MTCGEPYDATMVIDPDGSIKTIQQWFDDEYGEGFEIVDVAGATWAIKHCPDDPDGAEPDLEAEADALEEMLFD